MLSAFTTRASGNSRWIRSPTLSVFTGSSVTSPSAEKTSGLETSTSSFPASRSAPAARSASSATVPPVAFSTTSPKPAASAKVPCRPFGPACSAQATAVSLSLFREPSVTSWPSATSLSASVRPTVPVPMTANRTVPRPPSSRAP